MVIPSPSDSPCRRASWLVVLPFPALVRAQCAGLLGGSILTRSFEGQCEVSFRSAPKSLRRWGWSTRSSNESAQTGRRFTKTGRRDSGKLCLSGKRKLVGL